VLEFARRRNLGVLINRPLNAFTQGRLIRLAEVEEKADASADEVAERIAALADSEQGFISRTLPGLNLDPGLGSRIQAQFLAADALRQAWRSFSGYDHWRQVRDDYLLPRIRSVLEFLDKHASGSRGLSAWKDAYAGALEAVFQSLDGFYSQAAARKAAQIKSALAAADPDWAGAAPLSRLALRALRSTEGISCALVGMRRPEYVDDVLAELKVPVVRKNRQDSWQKLGQLMRLSPPH